MTAKDFFDLVSEMRKNQKDYFKTRSTESLRKSKQVKNGFICHEETIAGLAEEFSEFVLANEYLKSDHITDVSQAVEELTDILIVCLTELYRRDINIEKMLVAKMEFNEQR